jgi:PAS domain S-box-containing protein
VNLSRLSLERDTPLKSATARYAFAMATVTLALAIRLLLGPAVGHGAPFLLFFGAALVTSLFAGVGPALAAVALSLALVAFVFLMPAGYVMHRAVAQASIYSFDGLVLVYLTNLINRQRLRTRETVELAPDAYFLSDLDGRYKDVNQAACLLLGYTRDEFLQMSLRDVVAPEEAPRLEPLKKALLVPGRVITSEWTLRRKDGTRVPTEVSSNILSDGRWQGFVRDISEKRRVAAELEDHVAQLTESEERFRRMFEDAPIGMSLMALDGRFVRVNQALCEMTGYTAEELTQLTFRDVTHVGDRDIDAGLREQLTRGDIPRYQLEKRYIKKNGALLQVMVSRSLLRTPDGSARYYISQIEDVTERKRAAEALRRAVVARDEVLGIVAHDLRNPLSTIIMAAELLEPREGQPERRDASTRLIITRAAKRMKDLIQDLLDVAVMEAGRLKIHHERVAVADLAKDVLDAEASLAATAGLELQTDVAPSAREVDGDRNRLLRVFDNLVGNAIKFCTKGGRITLRAEAHATEVEFSVADTGPGIPPEQLAHVFDRFWQATTRARRLGAGLGLHISKGIVEAHGGHIWVESTVGRGTTFHFTIPTASPQTHAMPANPAEARAGSRRAPAARRIHHKS